MPISSTRRNPAMDIIRCAALFSVISVHFFWNNGFYDQTVRGWGMYVMVLIRSFFMICVPLFLLLTGWLMKNKKLEKGYFRRIGRMLAIYVLASLVCMVYKILEQEQSYSLARVVKDIMAFRMANYAWYIEMYIGLYFLIPFLNILYHNLESRKNKQQLLAVMLFLTTAPSLLNVHQFSGVQWWLDPASSSAYDPLIPDWWKGIYPLTYYFLGCYLREYPLKLKGWVNLLWIGVVFVLTGSFSYYRSYGIPFLRGAWQTYDALPNVLQSVLVFSFLARRDYGWVGPKLGAFLARLSQWSLGAYLVSYIFDQEFYPILAAHQSVVQRRMWYYPLIVPAVFLCSMGVSGVLNLSYDFAIRLIPRKGAAKSRR